MRIPGFLERAAHYGSGIVPSVHERWSRIVPSAGREPPKHTCPTPVLRAFLSHVSPRKDSCTEFQSFQKWHSLCAQHWTELSPPQSAGEQSHGPHLCLGSIGTLPATALSSAQHEVLYSCGWMVNSMSLSWCLWYFLLFRGIKSFHRQYGTERRGSLL